MGLRKFIRRQIGQPEMLRRMDDLEAQFQRLDFGPRSTVEQISLIYESAYGRPIGEDPERDVLLALPSAKAAFRHILKSERFRWFIREEVPLWPTDKWVCSEFQGLRMWVNLRDAWLTWGALAGAWEENEMKFVISHLEPGSTFLDVGANVGAYTLRAARHVGPTGKVICFEPRPDTSEMLARSIVDNGFTDRVELHRKAVGDADGRIFFHLDEHTNPGHSHAQDRYRGESDIEVDVIRLDALDFGDRRIDVMKMDVEGFEGRVLLGARETLRRHKPVFVGEFAPGMLRAFGGTSPEDYIALWFDLGYTVRLFDHDSGVIGDELTVERARDEASYPSLTNIVALPN